MSSAFSRLIPALLSLVLVSQSFVRAADLSALWAESVTCTVAVEFYVETETDRNESVAYGTVIDDKGTVILQGTSINLRVPPSQLKNFKMYTPGEPIGSPCEYLGVDALTGWHFLRASEEMRPKLKPVTAFAKKKSFVPGLAEEVWGIGLRGKDEDFLPYIMTSRVALVNSLPQRTGLTQQEVAAPGMPVFNLEGEFVGIGQASFGQNYIEFSRNERGGAPVMLVNLEESSAFLLAEEVLPYLGRAPKNPFGRPLAWLGTYGLQPVDPEVARFLKLENQSAALVSEVLEGSPAEQAGIQERDIIVAVNGKPLPRFKPDRVVTAYLDRLVDGGVPGDHLRFTLLRNGQRLEKETVLADAPKLAREAQRKYFERIGLTAREFIFSDAVVRRAKRADASGIIAHFVKPSSPAQTAGLQTDDWIKEIDGVEVKTFEQALERLAAIESDAARSEFVLLVGRGGETSVLRVKLR